MRLNRVYQDIELATGSTIELDKSASLHLGKVLRASTGDKLEVFNGNGHRYLSTIETIERNKVIISVEEQNTVHNESPLHIHLFQGVSRGDKMELTLQKGVELGVKTFTPIITERCGVKLDQKRWQKKLEHWQKIIISACEQSGRDIIPVIHSPLNWQETIGQLNNNAIFLDPHSKQSFRDLEKPDQTSEIQLLIGPEGGFSDNEILSVAKKNITPVFLGPRILRTETAALAAVAAINAVWGDF